MIHRVILAILRRSPLFLSWPNRDELRASADKFFDEHQLPNIPLGVDGMFSLDLSGTYKIGPILLA